MTDSARPDEGTTSQVSAAGTPDTRDDGCPRRGDVTYHRPDCPNALAETGTSAAGPKPLPTKAPEGLRTFTLSRQADSSGVSGTGVVMQGVQFATGRVVVQWLTPFPGGSVNIFDSLDQLLSIHVHSHPDNGTTLTFSDGQVIEA